MLTFNNTINIYIYINKKYLSSLIILKKILIIIFNYEWTLIKL